MADPTDPKPAPDSNGADSNSADSDGAEDRRDIQRWIHQARAAEGEDDPARYEAIYALHSRGDRATFDAVTPLLDAADPDARLLAVEVLAQLGVPERTLPEACFAALRDRLKTESDPRVLGAIGVAFSHLDQPGAVEAALPLASHKHPATRYGAVFGLMGHDEPEALDALIALSADDDPEVRNWATFALGTQTEVDTPAIRKALWARLDDTAVDAEIRGEALVGLAERGDTDIVDRVARALADGIDPLAIQAAALIGAPELHGKLIELRDHPAMTAHFRETLDEAIARCDPDAEV